MISRKKVAWVFFLSCAAWSCLDEPDCYGLNNNIVGITFKSADTFATITVDSLTVTSNAALLQLVSNSNAGKVYLPLNYFSDTTSYRFETPDTAYVLTLGHKSQSQFVSSECGQRFVLANLAVLEHTFDSVRLVSAAPGSRPDVNNLEIFW